MSQNLKAVVRYDGTNFAGWQIQPNARTIQQEIETALSRMANQSIRIVGSGRTDAGVHALGQVISFAWPASPDIPRMIRSLSGMLSPEVRVESIDLAPEDFNARYSAKSKRYAYALSLGRFPDPFSARYAWSVTRDLDMERISELARSLTGEHDFAGFQCSGAATRSTVRNVYSIDVLQGGVVSSRDAENVYRLEFHGDGFLYKMVRNMTGVLVAVARGALPESKIAETLASPGPFKGMTAPARGLFLAEVRY